MCGKKRGVEFIRKYRSTWIKKGNNKKFSIRKYKSTRKKRNVLWGRRSPGVVKKLPIPKAKAVKEHMFQEVAVS